MSAVRFVLLLCLLLAGGETPPEGPDKRWLNDDNQAMSYVCPRGGSISIIVSQYSNKTSERAWDFACKATFKGRIHCNWTEYVNRFDEGINFSCPSNSLICGVGNLHLDPHEDRKWKFYCCESDRVCFANCNWTSYLNEFQEYFSWKTPDDSFLVGAVRYHDDESKCRLRLASVPHWRVWTANIGRAIRLQEPSQPGLMLSSCAVQSLLDAGQESEL